MYRPAWFEKAAQGRSVLAIALDVHMTNTGSAERGEADQKRDLKLLRHVCESWKANVAGVGAAFDSQVLSLLLQALLEADEARPELCQKARQEYAEGLVP